MGCHALGKPIGSTLKRFYIICQKGMIFLFGQKKKKNRLFGSTIEPDCRYCSYNNASEEDVAECALGCIPEDSVGCSRFSYDPLKRTPRTSPPLPKFNPEDFSL